MLGSKIFRAAAIVLAGAAALYFSYVHTGVDQVSNDGYQYVDAASHLAAGECLCTTLAHFDEQVAYGHMPVPFTHFAPGYPLLLAALSKLGLSFETAGALVSGAGFAISLWIMAEIGLSLGIPGWLVAGICMLWLTHATALWYGTTIGGTETPFTAVVLALAAALVHDLKTEGRKAWLWPAIGFLAGAAYGLRYAGLFLIPTACAYIVWRGWKQRNVVWTIAGLAAAGVLMAAIQIRNIIDSGSWRGGFSSGDHGSFRSAVMETGKAFYHIVFGIRVAARFDVGAGIFVISAAALLFLTLQSWRKKQWAPTVRYRFACAVWLSILTILYVCGVMAAAMTTIANDLPRYYLPMYPLILILFAIGWCVWEATPARVCATVALLVAVLALQGRSLRVPPPLPLHEVARQDLAEATPSGISLGEWLAGHVRPEDVIVSPNGQGLHYVIHRPVVSVIEPRYSSRRMDEKSFLDLMTQFKARYLIVFPGGTTDVVPEQDAIAFLRDLAASQDPPAWLSVSVRTAKTIVFECGTCAVQSHAFRTKFQFVKSTTY